MPRAPRPPADPWTDLAVAWRTSARVTEYLLERLNESVWRSASPDEKGRTIAEIVAHVHNVRRMYLVGAGAKGIPPKMDRFRVTPEQARAGLARSAEAIATVLEQAAAAGGRLPRAPHSVVTFFSTVVTHEAHHRGQIGMLARQLGHPLTREDHLGLWDSAKRRKEALRPSPSPRGRGPG